MNKADLIKSVSKETGIIQSDVQLVVDRVLSLIRESVQTGNEIRLNDFGTFKTKMKGPKIARNLKGRINGHMRGHEPIYVPARTVVHFKPSKTFIISDGATT